MGLENDWSSILYMALAVKPVTLKFDFTNIYSTSMRVLKGQETEYVRENLFDSNLNRIFFFEKF